MVALACVGPAIQSLGFEMEAVYAVAKEKNSKKHKPVAALRRNKAIGTSPAQSVFTMITRPSTIGAWPGSVWGSHNQPFV
jgi:hypothetical protein